MKMHDENETCIMCKSKEPVPNMLFKLWLTSGEDCPTNSKEAFFKAWEDDYLAKTTEMRVYMKDDKIQAVRHVWDGSIWINGHEVEIEDI